MREHVFQTVKAVFASTLFSLAYVLLFSLAIQLFSLPLECIKPINQVFKIIIIAVGGLLFIRGERGAVKGFIYGLISVTVTFFLFSAISGAISFSLMLLLELFLGGVAGAISGIMGVNIKKRQ